MHETSVGNRAKKIFPSHRPEYNAAQHEKERRHEPYVLGSRKGLRKLAGIHLPEGKVAKKRAHEKTDNCSLLQKHPPGGSISCRGGRVPPPLPFDRPQSLAEKSVVNGKIVELPLQF